MKKTTLFISFIIILFCFGCGKASNPTGPSDPPVPTRDLISGIESVVLNPHSAAAMSTKPNIRDVPGVYDAFINWTPADQPMELLLIPRDQLNACFNINMVCNYIARDSGVSRQLKVSSHANSSNDMYVLWRNNGDKPVSVKGEIGFTRDVF